MSDTAEVVCTCTDSCPESWEDNDCPLCREMDVYLPCPVIGFGCGFSGPCDCCTPEQETR